MLNRNSVLVLDTNKIPCDPIHPSQARLLLNQGKAAVFRKYPFTIILKEENKPTKKYRIKIDPLKATLLMLSNLLSISIMFEQELIDKLYSRVAQIKDECWNYNCSTIWYKNKQHTINKVAFFAKYEGMPKGQVFKTCKNRFCCNPNHIFKSKEEYVKALLDDPNNYKLEWNEHLQDYCYSWSRTKLDDGYAKIRTGSKTEKLHRLVLSLDGISMDGLVTRHLCHNRSCVKREHLTWGSDADNAQDRTKANRSAKGENSGRAKITKAQALEIIKLLSTTTISQQKIATIAKTTYGIVMAISQGKAWTHLSGMPWGSKRSDWYKNNEVKQLSLFD